MLLRVSLVTFLVSVASSYSLRTGRNLGGLEPMPGVLADVLGLGASDSVLRDRLGAANE